MSLIQNSQQYHINPSKIINGQQSAFSEDQQPKREKSVPKFNRRAESRPSERKKPQPSPNIDHRICYLSPGKNSSGSNFAINTSIATTTTFQDVKHRFSINNQDLFNFNATHSFCGLNSTQPPEKGCSEVCLGNLEEKSREIERLRSRVQSLQGQVRLQKERAEALQIKVSEFQWVRTFLLQREAFISQILENNILLNENVMKCQAEKRSMEDHFGVLLQEKLEFEKDYERQSLEWAQRFKAKNEEIANLQRNTKKMQAQLSGKDKGKKDKGKEKQENAFKENIERGNNAKLGKSKSRGSLSSSKQATEFSSLDLNIIQEVPAQQRSSFEDDPNPLEKQRQQKLIKKLQEKIRYSEIEIDVLKKIKQDSNKLSKSNETLKSQNKKLLIRIDYLSRKCSKRGEDSDSSLELSLSPR